MLVWATCEGFSRVVSVPVITLSNRRTVDPAQWTQCFLLLLDDSLGVLVVLCLLSSSDALYDEVKSSSEIHFHSTETATGGSAAIAYSTQMLTYPKQHILSGPVFLFEKDAEHSMEVILCPSHV